MNDGPETTLGRMAFPPERWARPPVRPQPAVERIVRLVVETPEERARRKAAADVLSCRQKFRYDKRGAQGVVNQRRKGGAVLRAYACPICGGWHVARESRRD